MLVTCDDGLRQYLGQVLTQLSGTSEVLHSELDSHNLLLPAEWLLAGSVQNLVIAICDVETGASSRAATT